MMAPTLKKLQEMSDNDIVKAYDLTAQNTAVGLQFLLDELNRRKQDQQTQQMLKLTKQITFLTVITTISTLVSLCLAVWAFWR